MTHIIGKTQDIASCVILGYDRLPKRSGNVSSVFWKMETPLSESSSNSAWYN